MRNFVASILSAVMIVGMAAAATGCVATASIGTGQDTTPKPTETAKPVDTTPPPPVEQPKPVLKAEVKNGQLVLPGPVVFETGKDVLKAESDDVLKLVKDYLDGKPEISLLRIEGHTDSDGDDRANQTLSELRAMAVARWLVAKGTKCERLMPVGFGESKPIAPNDTPENKAQNRRTAFVNAALKGKPIGGMPVDGGGKVAGDPCK